MNRVFAVLVAVFVLAIGVSAEELNTNMSIHKGLHKGLKMPKDFRMVPMGKVQILQEGSNKMFCPKCGMTLSMFYKTNHAAKVDGKIEQFCSMYCLVEEIKSGKKIEDIQVVDNTTLKFIPVAKAWYVVGSSKPATMAKKISKYAFGTKKAAEGFAKKFGGKVMQFDEALKIAKENFESDMAAKKMRQVKAAKKGENLYRKMCKPIDKKFKTVAEAKSYIKSSHACGEIKGKPLQAIGLYLVNGN